MLKPSNRQCEVARLVTKSDATDEQIVKELNSMSKKEWNVECKSLDTFLQKHNKPLDEGWDIMQFDFVNFGASNSVDEATMFVAYMNWKSENTQ